MILHWSRLGDAGRKLPVDRGGYAATTAREVMSLCWSERPTQEWATAVALETRNILRAEAERREEQR